MNQELLLQLIKLAVSEPQSSTLKQGEMRICILQRGWIFVGKYYEEGNDCRLEDAACIRNWGTTKGLGELAEDGPTKDTKLDPCPTVRFHKLGIVAILDIKTPSKWKY